MNKISYIFEFVYCLSYGYKLNKISYIFEFVIKVPTLCIAQDKQTVYSMVLRGNSSCSFCQIIRDFDVFKTLTLATRSRKFAIPLSPSRLKIKFEKLDLLFPSYIIHCLHLHLLKRLPLNQLRKNQCILEITLTSFFEGVEAKSYLFLSQSYSPSLVQVGAVMSNRFYQKRCQRRNRNLIQFGSLNGRGTGQPIKSPISRYFLCKLNLVCNVSVLLRSHNYQFAIMVNVTLSTFFRLK